MTRRGIRSEALVLVLFMVAGMVAARPDAGQATEACVTTILLNTARLLDCEVPSSVAAQWSPQITANTLDLNLTSPNNGTLILTAGNNLQTHTNVTAGTLTITANSTLGPDNGALTLGGTQTGGGLTSGTLEITPVPFCLACLVFSWGGRITTLGSGGTIFVDVTEAAILSGTITNNSGLTIGAPGVESGQVTLSGAISGAGGLMINGTDNAECCPEVTLSGVMRSAGEITVNGGSLNILGAVRNRADSFIGTVAGTLAVVNVPGPGSWTLSGSKLVLGEAGEGDLTISNGGIVDASNGIVMGAQSGGFSAVGVSGAGSQLRTRGSITVGNTGGQFADQDLFGISDGGTMLASDIIIGPQGEGTLDNGTLRATGRGGVTIAAGSPLGGFLDGRGTVMAHLTNNGNVIPGLFIPGGPIGTNQTLSVRGDYTQGLTGTLWINVTPTVAGSLAVTKSATLAGTLALNFLPGTYAPGATYALVTAKHVLGTFGTLTQSGTNSLGLLVPALDYAPSQVTLGFTIDPLPDFAATPNQFAVATTLQHAMSGATGGDLLTAFNVLNYSTPAQLQAAYTALSGTAYTAIPTVAINTLDAAAAVVFGHWDATRTGLAGARVLPLTSFGSVWTANGPGGATWLSRPTPVARASREMSATDSLSSADRGNMLSAVGSGFWTQSLAGAVGVTGWGDPLASANAQTSGNLLGYDFVLTPRLRIGTAIGRWQSDMSVNDGTGQSVGVMSGLTAAYAQYAFGNWTLDTLAGYTSDAGQVARPLAFVGRAATAAYTTNDTIAAAQVGPHLQWDGMTVLPTLGVDYVQAVLPTVSESGADSLNLTVTGQSVTSVRGVVGVRLTGTDNGEAFRWGAYVNYGHEFGSSAFATTATLAGAPGNPFTVTGVSAAADTWGAGLGLTWRLQNNAEFHLAYDALLSAPQTSHGGSVTFEWHF
jgi:T5SS/PEP-CTERM-associated repeat protein